MCRLAPFQHGQTFLGDHIDHCLHLNVTNWESRFGQVPDALRDLGWLHSSDSLSLWNLLYGVHGAPSLPPLYQPVTLRSVTNANEEFDHLTQLIQHATCSRDHEQNRPCPTQGILLQGPPQSGKTITLWKTYFDCVVSPGDDQSSPLAGFLPLWLGVPASHLAASSLNWRDLILRVPFVPGVSSAVLEQWLQYSPPVLLFCDLDVVPESSRQAISLALTAFQREMSPLGHRCVVTGGVTQSAGLLHSTDFRCFQLTEWSVDTSNRYAGALDQWRTNLGINTPNRSDTVFNQVPLRHPGIVHSLALDPPTTTAFSRGLLYQHIIESTLNRCSRNGHFAAAPQIPNTQHSTAIVSGTTRLASWLVTNRRCACNQNEITQILDHPASVLPAILGNLDPNHRQFWQRPWPGYLSMPNGTFLSPLILDYSPFLTQEYTCGWRFLSDVIRDWFAAVMGLRYFLAPCQPHTGLAAYFPDWAVAVWRRILLHPDCWCGTPACMLGGVLTKDEMLCLVRVVVHHLNLEPLGKVPSILLDLLADWEESANKDLQAIGAAVSSFERQYQGNDRTVNNFLTVLGQYAQQISACSPQPTLN